MITELDTENSYIRLEPIETILLGADIGSLYQFRFKIQPAVLDVFGVEVTAPYAWPETIRLPGNLEALIGYTTKVFQAGEDRSLWREFNPSQKLLMLVEICTFESFAWCHRYTNNFEPNSLSKYSSKGFAFKFTLDGGVVWDFFEKDEKFVLLPKGTPSEEKRHIKNPFTKKYRLVDPQQIPFRPIFASLRGDKLMSK